MARIAPASAPAGGYFSIVLQNSKLLINDSDESSVWWFNKKLWINDYQRKNGGLKFKLRFQIEVSVITTKVPCHPNIDPKTHSYFASRNLVPEPTIVFTLVFKNHHSFNAHLYVVVGPIRVYVGISDVS